jgi:hypothetical protein
MVPGSLNERVETLIDDLIEDGGLASGSLASVLLAAREAVHDGYGLEFSRRVRQTLEELRGVGAAEPDGRPAPTPGDRLSPSRQAC